MIILSFVSTYVKEIFAISTTLLVCFFYKKSVKLKEQKEELQNVIDTTKSTIEIQQKVIKNIKDVQSANNSIAVNIKRMQDKKL